MLHLHRLLPVVLWAAAAPLAAQLDLPGRPAPKPKEPGEELLPPAPPRGDVTPKEVLDPLDLPGVEPAPGAAATPSDEVEQLFLALARTRAPAVVETTFQRLAALGPGVLPRARVELLGEHAPSVSVAGRLCLRLGTSAERAAVAERLTRVLAADVALALFEELLQRDPVLTAPEYVAGLLDHPGPALRARAVQELEARLPCVPLAALVPLLSSARTATRSSALELVARHPDPLAWNVLASRLSDPSAQLARRAAEILAALDGAEPLLVERAFPPAERPTALEWTRARAYALLALVEREERQGTALLEGSERAARVESLCAGLTSSQPIVAGAAAVALARVGFRASAAQCGPWLEREVPHQLVRAGTGAEFHADFSALERPALRALSLLSGESFGADGEAWRAWWVENAAGFRARHARIELGPEASRTLVVSFRAPGGRAFTFTGPEAAAPDAARRLRLDENAAARLLAMLEGAGVFGPQRLPSARRGGEVVLRVGLGGAEKAFAPAREEAWLTELTAELARLAEEERWQLYCDPTVTDAERWWQSEAPRWAALEPLARARAMAGLLLAALQRARGSARDEVVDELTRLYEDVGVPAAQDFEPFLAALAAEPAFAPRGPLLCELARLAAGAAEGDGAEPSARQRLLGLLLERFGSEADDALARVAQDLDLSSAERLATDARARARALGARGLVRRAGPSEAVAARLRVLLADPEASVQLALLDALGAEPDPGLARSLRSELLELARAGTVAARCAALAVLAPLGGRDVRDLALEAIGDSEVAVQAAGVAALAELADPANASLLASLFARGPGSPYYADARRGLRRIGNAGREECRRLARSASPRARREAALFLAETIDPAAAGLLVESLAADPSDARLLSELGVLAGQDFAAEARPSAAVAEWWDLVVHDDPLAWLLAAAERAGVATPPRALAADEARPEGARFLLALLELAQPVLVERAARELELRLAREFPRPATAADRARFVADLRAAVQARFGE